MKTKFEVTSSRTYATRENLEKALTKFGVGDLPHLICRNAEGRWTAVFVGKDCNSVIFLGFQWIYGY